MFNSFSFSYIRKQRDASRLLYRQSQRPLMFGARACYAAGENLPSFRNKPAKRIRFIIVDLHFLGAEFADFFLKKNFTALSSPAGTVIAVPFIHLHILILPGRTFIIKIFII
jgi:hypothetical protein